MLSASESSVSLTCGAFLPRTPFARFSILSASTVLSSIITSADGERRISPAFSPLRCVSISKKERSVIHHPKIPHEQDFSASGIKKFENTASYRKLTAALYRIKTLVSEQGKCSYSFFYTDFKTFF